MSKILPPPDESPLVIGARLYPGVRFHEGIRDDLLVRLAEDCSRMLALGGPRKYRIDGHPQWNERYVKIRNELGLKAVEVTAQADASLANAPEEAVVRNLYDAWKQSSGHWRAVSRKHKLYGDGVAQSNGGIWYGTIIVADNLARTI